MLAIVRSGRHLSLFALLAVLLLLASPTLAADFGQPVPGQHIYDTTGLLTPAEQADLEARAARVEAAGAPVVVYLQARAASQRETEADARALMEAWDLQSAPGARDGVVLFFNLRPDDLRRGEVFLYAGEAHYQGGNLPEAELRRILDTEMLPRLKQDQTAAGIGAGLDALAHALTFGPTEPSIVKRLAGSLTAGRFSVTNIFAAGVGLFLLASGLIARVRSRPSTRGAIATTMKPADRPPAIAGALVDGTITNAHLEATLLDLAQRGAIAIEPAPKRKVQIRLLDPHRFDAPYEHALWDSLELGSQGTGVVPSETLGGLQRFWGRARSALREQLEADGLFETKSRLGRGPMRRAVVVALLFLVVVVVVEGLASDSPSWSGAAVIFVAMAASVFLAGHPRETTRLGESEAALWRGYKAGITAARRERAAVLDLDEVLPYAVAFGVVNSLDKRLREASAAGWQPAWFNTTMRPVDYHGSDFYPYWYHFHESARASSSSSSSDSASSGGGGAGGSF